MKNDYHIKTSVLLSVEMSHIAISSIDYKVLLKSGDRLLGRHNAIYRTCFHLNKSNGFILLCNVYTSRCFMR